MLHNNRIHTDKIKLRRSASQLYFSGDAGRYDSQLNLRCKEKPIGIIIGG
jgi:hypothetical protein